MKRRATELPGEMTWPTAHVDDDPARQGGELSDLADRVGGQRGVELFRV